MSKVALSGNASGTGTFTIASPNSNTDRTLTLPDNTGTVITTGSIAGVTPAMLSQPLTSDTAKASTSGTSIDFTSIPSWVKRITVMFVGVSTNGTSPPQIQIGAGSVTTAGYLGSNSITVNGGVAAALFTSGFGIGVNTANWGAVCVIHGSIVLTLQTGNTWTAAGAVGRSDAVSIYSTAGSLALGGTLDRVRITTVNGTDTFDAGTINILYE
jgi:hypothetical protein